MTEVLKTDRLEQAKLEIRSFVNSLLDQSQNLTAANGRSAFVISQLEKLAVAERARNLELREESKTT